ncbi:Predicted phosphohydrolase [Formivibrio citricus]|uniref:Predicted phosphohydrolase n=1 Tax=Formivibrio citricus TaxID=83765 RepID=A0A1I5CUF9_9NEIS|nr:metallophosphoesterase [Formivibrio citricus]SFN90486.1 Predicted phosphohydrolase [Formivibrio citricus]
MRIHVLSDLHIEFGLMALPKIEADVIVLAGDIGVGKKGIRRIAHDLPNKPILFVAGNHEYYGSNLQVVNRDLQQMAIPNLHYLDNRAVVIEGVRFLGCTLWTDFRLFGNQPQAMVAAVAAMNDCRKISFRDDEGKREFLPEDMLALHQQSRAWLEHELDQPFDGPTVVVTHHGPHPKSLYPGSEKDILSAAYVSDLTELMGKAQLWVHGHIHVSLDYEVAGTRVICNPRGYHPSYLNPNFDPGLIVEV